MDKIGANLQASRPRVSGCTQSRFLAQMRSDAPRSTEDEGVPVSFPCMTDRTLVGSIIQEH